MRKYNCTFNVITGLVNFKRIWPSRSSADKKVDSANVRAVVAALPKTPLIITCLDMQISETLSLKDSTLQCHMTAHISLDVHNFRTILIH